MSAPHEEGNLSHYQLARGLSNNSLAEISSPIGKGKKRTQTGAQGKNRSPRREENTTTKCEEVLKGPLCASQFSQLSCVTKTGHSCWYIPGVGNKQCLLRKLSSF